MRPVSASEASYAVDAPPTQGVDYPLTHDELDESMLENMITVNCFATAQMCRVALPLLAERGGRARTRCRGRGCERDHDDARRRLVEHDRREPDTSAALELGGSASHRFARLGLSAVGLASLSSVAGLAWLAFALSWIK